MRTPDKTPVRFGTEALTEAQGDRINADIAKQLGVSMSTWARWKAAGTIPRGHVTDVVLLLGLPEPQNLDGDVPRTPWLILDGLEQISAALRDIAARLPPDPSQR